MDQILNYLINYVMKDGRPFSGDGTPLYVQSFRLYLQVMSRSEISTKFLLKNSIIDNKPHTLGKANKMSILPKQDFI